jgi:hypothetical protein
VKKALNAAHGDRVREQQSRKQEKGGQSRISRQEALFKQCTQHIANLCPPIPGGRSKGHSGREQFLYQLLQSAGCLEILVFAIGFTDTGHVSEEQETLRVKSRKLCRA